MYLIHFPIGDWSDDGHGICDWYVFQSNVDVFQLRVAHFRVKDMLGIDVYTIGNQHVEFEDSREIALKWAELLMQVDPSIELTITDIKTSQHKELRNSPVMLPFYGFDDQRRHIDFVGYEYLCPA